MKIVRARFREQIDHAARRPARFRSVRIRGDPYLGDRVHRRAHAGGADEALVVVGTVDHLIVLGFACAVDAHANRLALLVRAGAVDGRGHRTLIGARYELNQAIDIAFRQGNFLGRLRREQRGHTGTVGLQQRCLTGHEHGLADGAHLELGVQPGAIAARQDHLCRDGFEARQLNANRVRADRKKRKGVVSG